jgi:hypothetical protein
MTASEAIRVHPDFAELREASTYDERHLRLRIATKIAKEMLVPVALVLAEARAVRFPV